MGANGTIRTNTESNTYFRPNQLFDRLIREQVEVELRREQSRRVLPQIVHVTVANSWNEHVVDLRHNTPPEPAPQRTKKRKESINFPSIQ